MQAYLIDPQSRTIKTVEHPGGIDSIYKLIEAGTFDLARFNDKGDGIFVDDEGLLHGPVYQFFGIRGYAQPLAGKGLVLGCDEEGNSVSPSVPFTWMRSNTFWIEKLMPNLLGVTQACSRKTQIMSFDAVCHFLGQGADENKP
jgi:hypothetical protein